MLLSIKQLLHPTSLKYQLFGWLLILLLPIILISAFVGYVLTTHYINLTYDKALYRTALALADQVSLEELGVQLTLPQVAKDLLEFDEDDDIYFRIIGPSGDLISTHTNLPPPKTYPKNDQFLYYDASLNTEKLRAVVYTLPVLAGTVPDSNNSHVYVMVGETLKKRTLMANEIVFSMLLPQMVIVLLVSALLFLGIKRGLLPLDRLKTELSERNINDLSPVGNVKLPAELRPLINTFNDLLARLSSIVVKQQRFISEAAHQLKTPLAGLKTQAELALREENPTKISHALGQINQASGNLSHLVNQLLSLAKAEPEGTASATMETIDLRQLAQKVTGDWVSTALQKNIDLGFETKLQTALIQANTILLREMMNNLIDNAIRYTPVGGKITVGVKEVLSKLILYVQDNGIGIADDNQSLVFERFYRVLGSQQDGCGLGLTIVQEIAERHKAAVAVSSKGEGKGALFTVTFTATKLNTLVSAVCV
jgi:two-component system, OmpR family, sensor histidine kinase TctE